VPERTQPFPGGNTLSGYYDAEYFKRQDAKAAAGTEINLRWFSGYLRDDDTVMDFGCAGGSLLQRLPGKGIGVEINPVARAAAAERGITVLDSTAEIPSESIDVVVSSHTLEHTLEPFAVLQDICRTLRPGGRLVMLLPINDWRTDGPYEHDIHHHLYTWTPLLIRNLLLEAGFADIETTLVRHSWPKGYYWMWRVLPHRMFDLLAGLAALKRRERQIHVLARRPLLEVSPAG
jgi:SAM-dependent methyltransferase